MEESILTHKTRYLRSAFLRQKSKNEISQECVKWLIFRVAELELHGVGVQVGLLKVQRVRVGIFYLTLAPDVQFF